MATMNGIPLEFPSLDEKKRKIEAIRQRVSKMSDGELLRYGMTAKLEYEQGLEQCEVMADGLATELSEARAEWNQRYGKMPLRDSF